MEQNKEQLEKLLQFIDQLGQNPDNAWFVERLRTKYSTTPKGRVSPNKTEILMNNDVNKLNIRITNIEKYLGLDFDTDTTESIIDYSKIEDLEAKHQLESDNREMLRYRHGTRSHKVDFYEFCKYAHFQAEMLLNFAYEPVNHFTINECKEHVKYFFPDVTLSDKISTPADITYFAKMFAFTEEFFHVDGVSTKGYPNRSKTFWTLKRIEDTRNITNHRGKENFQTDSYKEWLNNTPFDEVIACIKLLSAKVQSIDRTTFLKILPQWINVTITSKLPSAVFVKKDSGESIQLSQKQFKLVADKQQGDIIQIKMDSNGNINDIKV